MTIVARLLLSLLLLSAASASAAEYFVSPEGNDANPGAKETPWQSLSLSDKKSIVRPGDVISVLPGVYSAAKFEFDLLGAAQKPIKIKAQAPGATLQGHVILNGNDIWLEGFDIQPDQANPEANSAPLTTMVAMNGARCKIINCRIHDCNGGGVFVNNDDCEIYGCVIYNNGSFQSRKPHGVDAGYGSRTLIENNIVFENYWHGIEVKHSDGADIKVKQNIVFSSRIGSLVHLARNHPRAIIEENILYVAGATELREIANNKAAISMIGGNDYGARISDNYFFSAKRLPYLTKGVFLLEGDDMPDGFRLMRNHFYNFPAAIFLTKAPDIERAGLVYVNENIYDYNAAFRVGTQSMHLGQWQDAFLLDADSQSADKTGSYLFTHPNRYSPSWYVAAYRGDPDQPLLWKTAAKKGARYSVEQASQAKGRVITGEYGENGIDFSDKAFGADEFAAYIVTFAD